MNRKALDELKQQIPLLEYLQAHDWRPARHSVAADGWGCARCMTITSQASWWIPAKSLFYCYGCGRGGDVIRFAELYHQVNFPQALALLRQWRGLAPLLHEAAAFYRMQLHRHSEAVAYLDQRGIRSPEVIEHMRIGYAPGGCLRGWLMQLGYPSAGSMQAGLVTAAGYDATCVASFFRWKAISMAAASRLRRHRTGFCRARKVACIAGSKSARYPEVILVEGLFDYAVLWQAGFRNVTCSLGTHLNARQFRQLCDGPRTVYLAFDADANGSGQQAAQSLSRPSLGTRHNCSQRSHCPRATIQTAFSSRAATRGSSNRCWRRLSHEVPRHLSADFQRTHKARFALSSRLPAGRLAGSIVIWTASTCVAWRTETLRIYAHNLLHFVRWWASLHHTGDIVEG